LTKVGEAAFILCPALTSIVIPTGVVSIAKAAFQACKNLASLTFDAHSRLTSIGYGAFALNPALTSFAVPDSVISMGNYALYGSARMKSATIGSKLTIIGEGTFGNCSALTTFVVPTTVSDIGYGAFDSCWNLTAVTFESPSSLKIINASAFTRVSSDFCIIKGYTTPPTVVDPTAFPTNPVKECSAVRERIDFI
jgi:hypothetical protein